MSPEEEAGVGAGAIDAAAVAEAAAAIAAGVAKLEIALGSESAQQRSILFGAAMELSEIANTVAVRMLGDGATASANTQRLLEQHMQNAITIAHQAAQRGIAHADLAQDRQWNVDETTHALLNSKTFQDAIQAVVVAAVQATATPAA